ncbi:sialic acid-binding Ig-like lectin 13 isoform X2 [Heptranchias perlo]|uniref:sialic acid-binding Ig-like lectin 13 isoform X2 n=1 Tax=Heptranchias perlo TaxID=212740 RepID=UPI003559E42C
MRSCVFLSLMTLTEVVCNIQWSVVIPKRVSAVLDSCALIPCTFGQPVHNARPKGRWIKTGSGHCNPGDSVVYSSRDPHGQRYNYDDRTELRGDLAKSQCSILINNTRKSDEGTYCFIVEIPGGLQSSTYSTGGSQALLSISDRPEISVDGELTSGKIARLTCSIIHSCPYDKLQLRWIDYNGSLPLPWDTEDGEEIVNEPSGSWRVSSVLIFTPSSAHDGKKLGCTIVLNGSPSYSPQTRTLEIKYGLENPTVNSSIVAVDGSSLLLYCTAWGKPAVSLRWVKNGEEISTSSTSELTKTFQNINSEDDGEYWCVAKNSLGTANSSTRISVEYKPTIVSGPTCTSSENWTDCNCSVRANPPANITWGLNGRIITGNRSDVKVNSWSMKSYLVQSSLTLTHPTGTGTGIQISCVAANVHGDCVSKYQPPSEEIFSWTNIFIIGGGAAGLVILIAVVVTVRRQRKKLGEAAYVSETEDDSVIYAVVQKTLNAENGVRITAPGLGITKSTKPDQNEGVLYTSINISNFRKQERPIQNEDTCEYAKIKHC